MQAENIDLLIKCLVIAGLLIAAVVYFGKAINNMGKQPLNMMDEDFKIVLDKIKNTESYKEAVDTEAIIDQFDSKYNGYENCAGYVNILYSERQNRKHTILQDISEQEEKKKGKLPDNMLFNN